MTIVFPEKQFVTFSGRVRQGYYLDPYLVPNLDHLKKMVLNKWDGVGIICGQVGSGKTTISQAICYFLDPTFNIHRIVFSGEELMKAIDVAQKGEAIIFDEAIMSLSSQDFATDLQKALIKKFTMIRSKNLFILLIIPNYFMMRKWFSVERTKFMIYTYSTDGINRGYFKFYSWNKKKDLYLRGYKYMDMNCVSPSFHGRFTDTEGFFVNPDEYELKKQTAIKALTDSMEKNDKQKLQEAFKDKILKIEIDNKQWRENQKEKYLTKFQEWKQRFDSKKREYKDELARIEAESLELQKSKDKQRIAELERDYSKLIYFCHEKIKEFWKYKNNEEMKDSLFARMLNEERVTDKGWMDIKKYYQAGQELSKLSV